MVTTGLSERAMNNTCSGRYKFFPMFRRLPNGREVRFGPPRGRYTMLASARRRPARWIAAIALTATAGFAPVISASTAGAASTDACGVKLAKASGGTWTCSFVDDFAGTRLDTNKWTVMDTATYGFYLGDTCFVKGQGLKVNRGQLDLTVSRKAPFACKTPWGQFQPP